MGTPGTGIPQSLSGWTFVDYSQGGNGRIVGSGPQLATPFERLQAAATLTLPGMISLVNRFVDRVISATLGSRSIPFGAGGTIAINVTLPSSGQVKIPHMLQTSSVMVFASVGQGGATPAFVASADVNNVTLTMSSSGTCNLLFLVHP